jgi:putative tail protein
VATLVLTAVGTALGGPIGGALGSIVGQAVDRQLFGPSRRGPKLGDLSVQTSSYGSPVPRVYGRMRVAGTVVWASDLEEQEASSGGKVGPERTAYSASLAVALSSRPIAGVGRIWADGKLIRGASGDFKVETRFRLMTGGEDQQVDPLIAAAEGIASTPAFRGVALAIFEDLDLSEFGNRIPSLTLEVEGEAEAPTLGEILADASGGLIAADDGRTVEGFAAYGTSVRDGIGPLLGACGIDLVEDDGRLVSPPAGLPLWIGSEELGCEADRAPQARIERHRAAGSEQPASLSLLYHDRERDYQASQMRASSGQGGLREERIELPAVLAASQAKLLAEEALARRWRSGDRLRLRLPPDRMSLRPGQAFRLAEAAGTWSVRSAEIDGMVVVVDAVPAAVPATPLPADPGRSVPDPDLIVGRTGLLLFELPDAGAAPAAEVTAWLAGSNEGLWKPVPVIAGLGNQPLPATALTRRAVLGRTETVLDARCPLLIDVISSVQVRLANGSQFLLHADDDALAAGENLALVGQELLQFGRAQQLGDGRYRLSRLLRGRHGTEWAAGGHGIGETFCLVDPGCLQPVVLAPSAVGAELRCTAHGIGDSAPLPGATRVLSGETLRPPSPCHLNAVRSGGDWRVSWVRRSHRSRAWIDLVGDVPDSFPGLYRVTLAGPSASLSLETSNPDIMLTASQMPAEAGQAVVLSVATVGPLALSHRATLTLTI